MYRIVLVVVPCIGGSALKSFSSRISHSWEGLVRSSFLIDLSSHPSRIVVSFSMNAQAFKALQFLGFLMMRFNFPSGTDHNFVVL